MAYYFALTWADWSGNPVLYIPLDPAPAAPLREQLELNEIVSLDDILHDATRAEKIKLSRYGLGVLPLVHTLLHLSHLSPFPLQVQELLASLNQTYDLIIDIDLHSFPPTASDSESLDLRLLQESDLIFWVTTPSHGMVEVDIEEFGGLRRNGVSFGSFGLVANQIGLPEFMDFKGLMERMELLGAKQLFGVPFMNGLRSYPLEHAAKNHDFLQAFLPMLIKVDELQPQRRTYINPGWENMVRFQNEESNAISISKELGIPYASRQNKILKVERNQNLEKLIEKAYARAHVVLPLFLEEKVLAIAVADPFDQALLDDIRLMTGCDVKVFLATKTQILQSIEEYYKGIGRPGGIGE